MLPSGGQYTTSCEPHSSEASDTLSLHRHELLGPTHFQDGNPFGPFWEYVGVDFDKSVLFSGISFSAYHQPQWMKK